MNDSWVRVERVEFFDEPIKCVIVDGNKYLFYRSSDYAISAYQARCPHKGGALSEECIFDGHMVCCPLHAWMFDLSSEGTEVHGYTDLPSVPVKISDGVVYVCCP